MKNLLFTLALIVSISSFGQVDNKGEALEVHNFERESLNLQPLKWSNKLERDAKKYADFMCKYQKLAEKAGKGDMSVISEYTKLSTEAATLATEMKGKYKDATDLLKFNTAYTKALEACSK